MSQEYRRVFADGLVRNLVATKSHEASAHSIGIVGSSTANVANDEPLFIQNAGSWADRPESMTAIGNLFLAGDWVRTNITSPRSRCERGRPPLRAPHIDDERPLRRFDDQPTAETATSLTRANTSCSTATGGQGLGLVAPLSSLKELADQGLISMSATF
jgi:hypothetical protein